MTREGAAVPTEPPEALGLEKTGPAGARSSTARRSSTTRLRLWVYAGMTVVLLLAMSVMAAALQVRPRRLEAHGVSTIGTIESMTRSYRGGLQAGYSFVVVPAPRRGPALRHGKTAVVRWFPVGRTVGIKYLREDPSYSDLDPDIADRLARPWTMLLVSYAVVVLGMASTCLLGVVAARRRPEREEDDPDVWAWPE